LVVSDKSTRVTNFQGETILAALELLASMGLDDFGELQRHHIRKRINFETMKSFADIYPAVEPGDYLSEG
jgi:hypothetical protein